MSTHRHENGCIWKFYHIGTKQRRSYSWTCTRPDGSTDRYPCDELGWIEFKTPPRLSGTDLIAFDAASGNRWTAQWVFQWDMKTTAATHWRPEPELPRVRRSMATVKAVQQEPELEAIECR